ncbi:MAG: hypothetical protein M3081_02835 [Gemmatimonadota bacterium]|nr:hypothetical protein [Gemmatimonadota bacterium]
MRLADGTQALPAAALADYLQWYASRFGTQVRRCPVDRAWWNACTSAERLQLLMRAADMGLTVWFGDEIDEECRQA